MTDVFEVSDTPKKVYSLDDLEQKEQVPFEVDGAILYFKFPLDMDRQDSANLTAIQSRLQAALKDVDKNSKDLKAQERQEQMVNAMIRVILPGFPEPYLTGANQLITGKKMGIIKIWTDVLADQEKKE